MRALRRTLAEVAQAVRAQAWFPHVPLAAALLVAGAHLLWVTFGPAWRASGGGLSLVISTFRPVDLPYLLIGVGMITMSAGLAMRSRLAWVVGVILTLATVLIALQVGHRSAGYLTTYDGALLAALLLAYRSFDRSSLAAATFFALTGGLLLLIYATFGSFYLGDQFSPPIATLVGAFYYAVVTMTTVGYGDIVPRTAEARLFAVSIILLGVAVFATSLSAVAGPLVRDSLQHIMRRRETRMKRENHFVVVGATPLAFNTYRELRRRGQLVTLILPERPDGGELDDADVVVGDADSLDVLRQAQAEQAQAVLAMSADDSDNAFVVLAVKELQGRARTVAAVNDGKHLERVKLVRPDIVIAPSVLGGELLAMALTGEQISGEFVLERMFHVEGGGAPGGPAAPGSGEQ
ncbi:MAG TPA: voltage-gated potassium channel protein [Dehalococcoidia bacterium]|nr:voltage-gated potassium channel protein [Dehalococcoidia bacterium]HYM71275.1 voltage-gated potassium channel protein [bacterium]